MGRLEEGGEVDTLIASLQRARGMAPVASPLDGLRFTDSRHAGDVWALSELWRSLGFDGLASAWRRSKTEVDVLGCLRLMVFNRLCDPGSKLGYNALFSILIGWAAFITRSCSSYPWNNCE